MFAIVQNGQIIMYINPGIEWTYDGVIYPAQWIQQSTQEQRAEIGLVDVVYGQQANQQYYWVSPEQPVYNSKTNTVDINYTAIPKNLTNVKGNALSQVDQTAYTILFPTDWMVVKSIETSTPMHSDWNSWRASIRSTADATKTAITAAPDVDAVANIMSNISWNKSPATLALEAEQAAQEANDAISKEAQ